MIAIVDYGVGNLFSLGSSLDYLGIPNIVTNDVGIIDSADRVILPGVGAFGDAMAALENASLVEVIIRQAKAGKPVMGICLGMQLLFESSCEYGETKGLGLLQGEIKELALAPGMEGLKVPHMGWNSISVRKNHPLLKYSRDGDFVYYVHSYYAPAGGCAVATTSYGGADITGIAAHGNIMGCQFHPEKSGDAGLRILKAFNEFA